LLIGESPIFYKQIIVKYIKNIIKTISPFLKFKTKPIKKIFIGFKDLYPPNEESGDHYYRIKDYMDIFSSYKYSFYINKQRRFTTFVAVKPGR